MILSLLLFLPGAAIADEPELSVGLVLPYGVQPGVQVGLTLGLTERVFLRPQLAVFTRPGVHSDLMTDVEIGLRSPRGARGWSASTSLGVAYLLSLQVRSKSVDIGTADVTRTRAFRHHVVPALNGEVSWTAPAGLGAYARMSVGWKVPIGEPSSLWFMPEIGVRIPLGAP